MMGWNRRSGAYRRKIAEKGIPVEGVAGYRPHVTLAGYVSEHISTFEMGIVPVVEAMHRFPIRLEGIGIFPRMR